MEAKKAIREVTILCNVIMEVTAHQSYILLVRRRSQVPPTLRGRRSGDCHEFQEVGVIGEPSSCLPRTISVGILTGNGIVWSQVLTSVREIHSFANYAN